MRVRQVMNVVCARRKAPLERLVNRPAVGHEHVDDGLVTFGKAVVVVVVHVEDLHDRPPGVMQMQHRQLNQIIRDHHPFAGRHRAPEPRNHRMQVLDRQRRIRHVD